MEIRNETMSQNFLISYIKRGLEKILSDLGLWTSPSNHEWQVVRANQPTIQAMQDNTLYFDIISKKRIGVQGTKNVKYGTDEGWYLETSWFEEYLIQVSGFKQRNVETDDELTQTSSDVVSLVQACINADTDFGSRALGAKKNSYFGVNDRLSVIWTTELREIDYETDSGLKDKLPQFDFKIIVRQRLLKKTPSIAKIDIETKRI